MSMITIIVTTNKWSSSNLKGETEWLLVAVQDQVINIRNYQKVICGQQVESKCRTQHEETLDHIISGCVVLAKIDRHNKAAAFLHWSICKDHDIEIRDKWYNRAQANNYITIMRDMPVNTDRTTTPNRLDIVVKDLSEFQLKSD